MAYVPEDLAKASLVHIAPSDPMASIVQQCSSLGSKPTFALNHHYKKDHVSNPVW